MHYSFQNLVALGNRVVDMGCGSGQILDDFLENFDESFGLDASMQRLLKTRTEANVGSVVL